MIRQHLARLSVLCDATLECLDHQARLLVMRHRPRHEVARVVVHEADQVDALMPAQLEREDVALPELIGLAALEPTRRLVTRLLTGLLAQQSLLVQDAPDRRLRHAQPFEAREHVANPPCSPLRVRRSRRDDLRLRRILRCLLLLALRRRPTVVLARHQCLHAAGVKQRHELLDDRR